MIDLAVGMLREFAALPSTKQEDVFEQFDVSREYLIEASNQLVIGGYIDCRVVEGYVRVWVTPKGEAYLRSLKIDQSDEEIPF